MGKTYERLADLAKRCGDLSPIRDDVRRVLVEGNRQRALRGVDVQGVPFKELAPSTLKRRDGSGPPLAPHRALSRVVTGYVVDVQAGPGRLTFAASWPDQVWMEYHHTGTPHMPRRDPYGFRRRDLESLRGLMQSYVVKGSWRDWVSRAAALF